MAPHARNSEAWPVRIVAGAGRPPIIEPCIIQPPQLSWPVQLAMWLVIQVTIELHQLCGVVVNPRGFAVIHCSQVASM
jgi:hypothetical protein